MLYLPHLTCWHHGQKCANGYEEKSDQGGLMSRKERYVWVWQWKSKWTWKFDLVCQIREQLRCERPLTISLTSKHTISILTKKKNRKWVSCVTKIISFKGQWGPWYVQSNDNCWKIYKAKLLFYLLQPIVLLRRKNAICHNQYVKYISLQNLTKDVSVQLSQHTSWI